jgi:fucose permease
MFFRRIKRSLFKSKYPTWIGVAIAFYAFIAIGIAEGGLGVLLPSILSAYQLTPATVTLLFVSQVSGYMAAALTSSAIASRLGLARMLLLAAIALASALTTYALAAYWLVMVAVGTLLGLGIGLIDAGINTYIVSLSLVLLIVGLLSWWLLPDRPFSLPLIGFSLAAIFPATISLPQRISATLVPAAVGFVTSVASLGAATFPTAVGWIADRAGLESIPALMVPLAIVMVVLHAWLVRHAALKNRS